MQEQLAEICNLAQEPAKLSHYSSNEYGNCEYVLDRVNIRGCYWDRVMHNRDTCEDLQKAINCGEVHYKGRILHLGQKDVGNSVRVPVPIEVDGKIIWQKDWVYDQLRKKESEMVEAGPSGTSNASCITVESSGDN